LNTVGQQRPNFLIHHAVLEENKLKNFMNKSFVLRQLVAVGQSINTVEM
jgi:hypothetical protein